MREARAGVRAVARMPGLRAVIAGSSAVVLFAGLFNVGELLLAEEELGAGDAGFALLVAMFGLGCRGRVARGRRQLRAARPEAPLPRSGSASPASASSSPPLRRGSRSRRSGSPWPGSATGSVLVHERLLVQVTVADGLLGRVFGLRDTLDAWAWTIAFASAGLLLATLDTRAVLALAGAGVCAVAAASAWVLQERLGRARRARPAEPLPQLVERLDVEEPVAAGAR